MGRFRCREYRKKGRRHRGKEIKGGGGGDRNGEKRKEGKRKRRKAETEIQNEIEGKIFQPARKWKERKGKGKTEK